MGLDPVKAARIQKETKLSNFQLFINKSERFDSSKHLLKTDSKGYTQIVGNNLLRRIQRYFSPTSYKTDEVARGLAKLGATFQDGLVLIKQSKAYKHLLEKTIEQRTADLEAQSDSEDTIVKTEQIFRDAFLEKRTTQDTQHTKVQFTKKYFSPTIPSTEERRLNQIEALEQFDKTHKIDAFEIAARSGNRSKARRDSHHSEDSGIEIPSDRKPFDDTIDRLYREKEQELKPERELALQGANTTLLIDKKKAVYIEYLELAAAANGIQLADFKMIKSAVLSLQINFHKIEDHELREDAFAKIELLRGLLHDLSKYAEKIKKEQAGKKIILLDRLSNQIVAKKLGKPGLRGDLATEQLFKDIIYNKLRVLSCVLSAF